MSTYIRIRVALGGIIVLGLIASGCYTQFGSVQDDRQEDPLADEEYAYGDSTSAADYEYARRQFYYDYYYPSVMIGVGFGSPWYGGFYPPYAYGYYSPWVDPWYGWCGTMYPGYYGYRGYAAYWHTPSWGYYPYYGHGSVYYPGNGGSVDNGSGPYGGTRTFGFTRTSGSTRGTEVLPVGARSSTPVGKTANSLPPSGRVSTGRRGQEGERQGVTGTRPGGQRPANSSGNTYGRREAPRWYPRPSVSERPAHDGSRGSSSGMAPQGFTPSGRGGGDRSGGTPSYSPPPSSPPPSGNSGGSAPSNTGARGGNHR